MPGQVVSVVGVVARFAPGDRNTAVGVAARHVGRKVEV